MTENLGTGVLGREINVWEGIPKAVVFEQIRSDQTAYASIATVQPFNMTI
jgi:hypothetical protein